MESIQSNLVGHGRKAYDSDLAHNLLYWMGWSFADPLRTANRMVSANCICVVANPPIIPQSLSGDPLLVFNRDAVVFTASNMTHDCTASSQGQFISSTGMMSATYNMATFTATAGCSKIINAGLFGYDSLSKPSTFTVSPPFHELL